MFKYRRKPFPLKLYQLIAIVLAFCTTPALSQVDHWESVILEGDVWEYLVPGDTVSVPGWEQPWYNGQNWNQGNSGIGYGDNDDATVISPAISLFMRIRFNITAIDQIETILLDMDYDDSFVAYLNGIEVARSLVSGYPPVYNQLSDGDHEALLYNGLDPERFKVAKDLLYEGENLLAIEIHNRDVNSSDMTSIPTLSLGINSPEYNYRPVPGWFDEPIATGEVILESSNLPIVIIETTGGREIPNEPKIGATMTIIDNGEGVRNYVNDAGNPLSLSYDGAIQIEVRGSTSSLLPKKQYALTTYDGLGVKQNVSILGMPEENDWVLNGFAYDPSLMRDYISYQLSRQIGQYASRGVYCEVILNGEYQGLYVLQEKLKADDNRIDINKIDLTDNSGKDLTGGYITKADKTEGSDVAGWWMESYVDGYFTAFIHEHPKPTTVTGQQHNYIEGQFRSLEFAAGRYNNSLTNGYPSIIDLPSFIDFMLINELASNVDAYQFSTFFHKDRNGKLRAGPVWDFNLTYGNDLFNWGYDRSHTDVWQFDDGGNVGPRFWKDLFDEPTFKCYLRKRWLALTQPGQPLNANQILLFIDDVVDQIDEAVQRENIKWGTAGNHSAHVYNMKRWIMERIDWMTAQLGQNQECFGETVPDLAITKIHYHPMTQDGTGEKDREFIEITNVGDETVDLTGVYFGGTGLVYQFPANSSLPAGNRVLLANNMAVFKEEYGLTAYDEYSRSLNNGGQRIELLNGYGNLIDEVTYSDMAPWPVEADGQGYFLEVIDPAGDNNDPSNWQAAEFLRTSVSSEAFEPRVEVYPNPTQQHINLKSNSPIKAVTLMDFEGRVLLQKQGTELSSQLNLEGLKTAIYLLTVQTDNGIYTQKILLTN